MKDSTGVSSGVQPERSASAAEQRPSDESAQELRKRQAEFAKQMHGDDVRTGMAAWFGKNKAANEAINKYLEHWDGNVDREAEERRAQDYNESTHSYYNVVTDFYEYGWGTSFHFSRFYPGESFAAGVARHEHYLAYMGGIQSGDVVLDVGCGVGGPAREIARFTGCKVVGLNNNDYQIKKGEYYSEKFKLKDQVSFVKGDFMKMDFEDETFDKVYSVEATCHAPSFEGVYGEIYRVLKPGGTFAVYEWVMTEVYDESNPEHRKIAYEIELGDSIPKMHPVATARDALRSVGFEILHEQDLADNDDEVPWYYPLTGDWMYVRNILDVGTFFRTSYMGRKITSGFVYMMETIGLAPKGSGKVLKALESAAQGLVEGGEKKLFTPMMLFVARKPERGQGSSQRQAVGASAP